MQQTQTGLPYRFSQNTRRGNSWLTWLVSTMVDIVVWYGWLANWLFGWLVGWWICWYGQLIGWLQKNKNLLGIALCC